MAVSITVSSAFGATNENFCMTVFVASLVSSAQLAHARLADVRGPLLFVRVTIVLTRTRVLAVVARIRAAVNIRETIW